MAIRSVECQLNGHVASLRLDLGAMAALEDQGYEIEEFLDFLSSGKLSATRLRVLLWAMCQGEEKPPSLQDIGRWVDGENMPAVVGKIGEALTLAFPSGTKEAQNPPAGVGTGQSSSALPTAPLP